MSRAERILAPLGLAGLARSKAYRALRDPAWSFAPRARSSRVELRRLHNAQLGEHGHIIGTGPSLRQVNFGRLRDHPSIALNRYYLGIEEFDFVPDFLVSVNLLMLEQFAAEFVRQPCQLFAAWAARNAFQSDDNVTFLNTLAGVGFSRDLCQSVYTGATVTHVALQLAHWLGWASVTLIGIDHNYELNLEEKRAGPHNVVHRTADDRNHFSQSYFGSGTSWQVPDLKQSEAAYELARREFEASDRKILYGTVGGSLKVFDRSEIDYSKQ